jgi:hypothetical protein
MQDGERERWWGIYMFGKPTGQTNAKVSYFEESFLYGLSSRGRYNRQRRLAQSSDASKSLPRRVLSVSKWVSLYSEFI